MAESVGGGKLPLAPPNLQEIVSTLVKFQRWMKCRARSRAGRPWTTTPMSRHGIRGVVSLSMKSGERSGIVSWGHLRHRGEGGDYSKSGIIYPAHLSPEFCPCSQLSRVLEEGTLTLKWPVQLHPVLSDKIAVVLAQPEELVVREVWGVWRV